MHDDHLLDSELLVKPAVETIKYIHKEKLLLMLSDDLITKEIALNALENTKLACSMASLPSDEFPLLMSVKPSKLDKTDGDSGGSETGSEVSENYDAYAVLQENYDQIADLLGETDYPGDCQVLTVF